MNDTTRVLTVTMTDPADGRPATIMAVKRKVMVTIAINRSIAVLIDSIFQVGLSGPAEQVDFRFRDAAGAPQKLRVTRHLIELVTANGKGQLKLLPSEAAQLSGEVRSYALNGAWMRRAAERQAAGVPA